ncbi:MAG: DUF2249 domain-containing protein [Thermoplasmata archaeon]
MTENVRNDRPTARTPPRDTVLDVRSTPPSQRHPKIFGAYERLAPGGSFVLVNDHDPKPLYYQFQAEHTGQFVWEYLETGPETWRVRIGKLSGVTDAHRIPVVG